MKKDQIAIYLNEHPEFFNDYPELLRKIKSIEESDLPLEPLGTLSIADRILKRVHDDKEHLKSQFEWIMEIVKANENIQWQLHEIERLILGSTRLPHMLSMVQREIAERFAFEHVVVFLADYSEHLIERKLQERYGKELDGTLCFVEQSTIANWFGKEMKPILRGDINGQSLIFTDPAVREKVNSEALLPIILRGGVVGVIGLGCSKPFRFYPELRTEYLERLTDKLALVIDNMLLLDLLKRQPAIDMDTGFYNETFLDPVLMREFDRAKRYKKSLICVKMRIDYFADLINTYKGESGRQTFEEVEKILKESCRASDFAIRCATSNAEADSKDVQSEEFVILLPEISLQEALRMADRISKTLEAGRFLVNGRIMTIVANIGVAAYPGDTAETHDELLAEASRKLALAIKARTSRTAKAPATNTDDGVERLPASA
jgi:diguanylate cyclase (GGDEF)-like protein